MKNHRNIASLFLILVALFPRGSAMAADDFAAGFSTANRLYARGKFADAAGLYQKLLASGRVSANLLFNDGNAEFRLGNNGKAIAAFLRAERLAPRDPDIRANLDFVRKQAGDNTAPPVWEDWLGQLTLNEWTCLAAAAFWLAFLLFAAAQIRPALRRTLRPAAALSILLALLFGSALAAQAVVHFSKSIAVVVQPRAVARSGPFADARQTFAARDGAEFPVLDRRGNWVQVNDSGKFGWLSSGQIAIVPGA
ncbi:MAG: tetratricopeptide repeat protein [Verrucomicrobia bacterium]|nr:tetratricopeptide repeat protein [Verrucomicrobiota bacterium]MDE3098505.1 tetratricopeptide repeat protein [Verrucomicrobiota bacterium]